MALATQKKPATPAAPTYVSLSPDDASHGGLVDDVDVIITDAATCEWDYNGQQAPGPALAIEFTDRNNTTYAQYYSAGKLEDWTPTPDGCGFAAVSGKTQINDSTNVMKFTNSLVEAGFPKETLALGNMKCLIGTDCHVNQIVVERKGLIRTGKNADRPSTCLLVSKIHSLPGADTAKSATKGAVGTKSAAAAVGGKPNGKAATATKATDTDEIDTVLTSAIIEALGDTDPLPKKSLLQIASAAFKGTPNHSKAIARVNSAAFIATLSDSGVSTDGAQFTLAG